MMGEEGCFCLSRVSARRVVPRVAGAGLAAGKKENKNKNRAIKYELTLLCTYLQYFILFCCFANRGGGGEEEKKKKKKKKKIIYATRGGGDCTLLCTLYLRN